MASRIVTAYPSLKTAIFSWLTKMAFQWVVFCTPMLFIFHYICPDIVFQLFLKLIINSTLVAFGMTGLMAFSKVTLDDEGLRYENKLVFQKNFIPWKEMTFGKPFPIALEKHYVLVNKNGRAIKIWPSMNNYQALKQSLEDRQIFLETGQIAKNVAQFRPLDDVISEALR